MISVHKIKNYDDILIDIRHSNTLLVLDIDETIIKFPEINQKWWDDNLNYYYTLYEMGKAKKIVFNQWLEKIHNNDPIMLDINKYNLMIDKANNHGYKIIFLTARPPDLRNITEKNLDSCNIKYNKDDIYFLPNEIGIKNKGQIIIDIVQQLTHINNIIFVDDVMHNIDSVINEFTSNDKYKQKYNLELYLMNHENLI